MDKNMKKGMSFRTRIFCMILCLLGSLFVAIFIFFNIFIGNFIKTDAIFQLSVYADLYNQHNASKGQTDDSLPDMSEQPKNRTGTRAEVFTINTQYEILNFHENEDGSNTQKVAQIATYLKENQMDLGNLTNFHLKTGGQEYYITLVQDQKQEATYAVFYVDITTVSKFADTINYTLIITVLIAAVISFIIAAIIANSVNKPVKQLMFFARQIGKGNFTKRELSFTDREFTELADVMNQTAHQLDNYDHEQRTFFQNVSHEFRTPLMSIKCYSEGIEHGVMNPVISSRVISNEVERLSEMVEDLLVLSRMDNLTQKLDKATNDLRETFSACAEGLKPIADKKGISFSYDFDKSPVLFDYSQKYMARALNNLITNALRYANSHIVLTCRNDGKTIKLSVADDGLGIPAEDLPHIFERFYKGKNGNHGIGLSIVKSVVALHGGRISVVSDKGALFLIEFDK